MRRPRVKYARPDRWRAHVEGSERKDQVHDRHVLAVAEQRDGGGAHERRCEAERQRQLEPMRRHLGSSGL